MTPVALILDRLVSVDQSQALQLYQDQKALLNESVSLYFFVPFIFAVLMLLRPAAQYTYTFYISTSTQRFLQMFIYVTVFLGYFVYMESASFLNLKDFVLFTAMAYLVPYQQELLEEQWTTK